MIKQLIYRIGNVKLRAMCMIAIETGASDARAICQDANIAERN
jgi:hypothetical protein